MPCGLCPIIADFSNSVVLISSPSAQASFAIRISPFSMAMFPAAVRCELSLTRGAYATEHAKTLICRCSKSDPQKMITRTTPGSPWQPRCHAWHSDSSRRDRISADHQGHQGGVRRLHAKARCALTNLSMMPRIRNGRPARLISAIKFSEFLPAH